MRQFAQLVEALDSTNSTNGKVAALVQYLKLASADDALWCVALLTGRRPKRSVSAGLMRAWAAELCQVEPWLFEESYHVVGDLAETIALLLPPPTETIARSLTEVMHLLLSLASATEEEKRTVLEGLWLSSEIAERFVLNKLLTGGFRMGISEKLVIRALAQVHGMEASHVQHRLMGSWTPQSTTYHDLLLADNAGDDLSKPYPFMLAYPLETEPEDLGPITNWQAEWKWDGIRSQVIIRHGQFYIWSRGEELITDKFPELETLAICLPSGTVLDGELIGWKDGKPLPFQLLQTRITRKSVTKKQLQECPVVVLAYDILEHNGQDVRHLPLTERRTLLEQVIVGANEKATELGLVAGLVQCSAIVQAADWEGLWQQRSTSREQLAEGLMLKATDSTYQAGRKRGAWWKWKVEPYTIDAVMIYAQRGHGRRANMYTDFTFAVWDQDRLVPFAKAYSGLTDKEMAEVDAFVKKNTIEKFGPVRSVTPELVFELAFDGIGLSTRHKSGIAVRFPRIVRWRKDKLAKQADTLEVLRELARQRTSGDID